MLCRVMTDGYPAAPNGAPHGGPPGPGENYAPPPNDYGKRPREDDYGPNKRAMPAAGNGAAGPETVYRLLCDQSIIGGMLGRGGENIQGIQNSTGAFIQAIQDVPPHCMERVIVVAAPKEVPPGEQYNAAQQALFQLFDQQLQLDRSNNGPVLRCALLASLPTPLLAACAACACIHL